ncbi:MAG: PAS domain-containing protein [Deltaproteobacteria bacterium]|nr:PAS domain-containing protein [Myxococcales bacterium]MDP3214448.1 PAS domain-containing protein [Deltaproteobacteria bacterium]
MASHVDYQGLFEVSPNAYMVVDRDLRYVAANATYLRETGSRLDQLLGRYLFDLFPNDPDDPNNDSARMLQRSLERVLETGERDHLAVIPYRVPKEVDGQLVTAERHWSATHSPVLDAAGRVAFVLQHTVDVTELGARGEGGHQPADAAGVLSRARAVQVENARLDAEREHLRMLFEQAPGFMCFLEGRDLVFTLANEAYLRLVGRDAIVGLPLRTALPEVVEQGFVALLEGVYDRAEAYVGTDVRLLLQRRGALEPEEVFVDFIYQPVRGADGATRGIFVQGHDVTARKVAEREREAARRAAEAFSGELVEQSRAVRAELDRATARITELEALLGSK